MFRKGEIVSVFGRIGCGAMELGESLFGLRPLASGNISIRGDRKQPTSPRGAIDMGIGFVSVDRKTQGILPVLSAGENLTVAAWSSFEQSIGNSQTKAHHQEI